MPKTLVIALMLMLLCFTSCGWKGEPMPDNTGSVDGDTAKNDLTYTAVTASATIVSAIGAKLKGFVNTNDAKDYGFLVSRNIANPTRQDAKDYPSGTNCVKDIPLYDIADDNSITTRIQGLIPYTKFYFRAYVTQKDGQTLYGVVKTFMTQNLTITLTDPPTRIGLFDADILSTVSGMYVDDYATTASLHYRCSDEELKSPTTPTDSATYDKTLPAQVLSLDEWRFTANFGSLSPSRRYYVMAFMNIESDFYDTDTDNPLSTTGYKYGVKAADVATDKFKSNTISLTLNALNGVRSITTEEYNLDYDKVTLSDCYFSLPSDTLSADEYGIQLSTLPDFSSFTTHASTDDLHDGNHYATAISGLELKTKYYFRAYVIVRGFKVVSQLICSFTTKDYIPVAVDLDLSVKWADKNVGSWSKSVPGAYYSWGELSQKDYYDEETYVGPGLSTTDIAGTKYDAATRKYGDGWRLPTSAEVKELFTKCEWKWVKSGDIYGYQIIADNENSIFLPAGGFMLRNELYDLSEIGYFWTAERAEGTSGLGKVTDMYFRSGMTADDNKMPLHTCTPSLGLTIRAVYTK